MPMVLRTDATPRPPTASPPTSSLPRAGSARVRASLHGASAAIENGATRFFNRIVDLIVRLLVPFAVIALMLGIARAFLDLWAVYRSPSISAGFDLLVTDILSMFVVIELLKSIIEYFELHRINLTLIVDAAVVFVLREIMIGLYKHALGAADVAALAALLAVLGAFRIAAARFSLARDVAPETRRESA